MLEALGHGGHHLIAAQRAEMQVGHQRERAPTLFGAVVQADHPRLGDIHSGPTEDARAPSARRSRRARRSLHTRRTRRRSAAPAPPAPTSDQKLFCSTRCRWRNPWKLEHVDDRRRRVVIVCRCHVADEGWREHLHWDIVRIARVRCRSRFLPWRAFALGAEDLRVSATICVPMVGGNKPRKPKSVGAGRRGLRRFSDPQPAADAPDQPCPSVRSSA